MRASSTAVTGILAFLLAAASPIAAQAPAPPQLAIPVLVRYEDPVGDPSGGIGPDIVSVTLTAPTPGSVAIAIEFTTDPPLSSDLTEQWTDMLMIIGSTSAEGVVVLPGEGAGVDADFATGLHGATLAEAVATGAHLNMGDETLMNVVPVSLDGATVTLTLDRTLLGDPEQIMFFLGTTREGVAEDSGDSGTDMFPDSPEEGPYAQVAWRFATD